jgi:hypothetical protein
MTTTHVITIVIQNKAQSYTKWTLEDHFIPLTIETYDYFHPRFDSFLTSCVYAIIAHR